VTHGIRSSLHSPQMALLLRGIRHSQAQAGSRLVRLPIPPTLMRRIKSTLARHADSYDSILLWAACFLWCGEFLVPNSYTFDPDTHLSLDDVSPDTSASLWFFLLTIKASKLYNQAPRQVAKFRIPTIHSHSSL